MYTSELTQTGEAVWVDMGFGTFRQVPGETARNGTTVYYGGYSTTAPRETMAVCYDMYKDMYTIIEPSAHLGNCGSEGVGDDSDELDKFLSEFRAKE